jgi:hypothetical protein
MKLGKKQELFSRCLARLLVYAFDNGYEVRMGQVERSKEEAQRLANEGNGIANSLHTQRLAGDLYLFKDGKYLTRTADYKPLGDYWESLHELCRWGGSFNDGNHFSVTHGGRK